MKIGEWEYEELNSKFGISRERDYILNQLMLAVA